MINSTYTPGMNKQPQIPSVSQLFCIQLSAQNKSDRSAPVRILTPAVYSAAIAYNEHIHAPPAFTPRKTASGVHRTGDQIVSGTVILVETMQLLLSNQMFCSTG